MIALAFWLMSMVGINSHQDKVLHALAGATIAFICSYNGYPAYGVIGGFVAGVGKELYDKYKKKTKADYFDFFVTFSASVVVTIGYAFVVAIMGLLSIS